jgi:hypothetical protein
MAISWVSRWFKNKTRTVHRPVRAKVDHGRFRPLVEALTERVMPAVTATFSAAGAILRVVGDALDNNVVVSRDAAGTILVNNGDVPIQGGPATVTNTHMIMINGVGGNDSLSLSEANGPMPDASIFGGDGNDVIVSGSGIDFIEGGPGNDTAFLGAGDDTFAWLPGDGSDVVEGQGGRDVLTFIGSDLAEKFDISDSGNGLPFHRVRFTRDIGGITMDLNGVEDIDLTTLGGADTVTVNDQSATDIFDVNLDLSGSSGTGDGQVDAVIINGTAGNDFGQIASFGTFIGANVSFFPFVNITGSEGANDTLTVNAFGGNDGLDATSLAAGLIKLTVTGGAGNDILIGSQGGDTFVWNPGDGSDTIDGQASLDKLNFNGSDAAENFVISRNDGHVRLTSDLGNVAMDLNAVEGIELNARGEADTIVINDLTGTGLIIVEVDLGGPAGGGDGQADSVILNGTNGGDAIRLGAAGNTVLVDGLSPAVNITGSDGLSDQLTVNALGGNDTVDIAGLPAGLIGLTVNLGDGQAAPRVTSLAVNGGAAQRSRVTDLSVIFSAQVSFATTPGAAVTLRRNSDGAVVTFTANASVVDGVTVVSLSGFGGAATQFGSLADGDYTLTTLANQVSANGVALDGNRDGIGGDNSIQGVFRFFGDVNGDRRVDIADFGVLSTSFGLHSGQAGFLAAFDFNNDGVIDIADFGQFSIRLFTVLP